MTSLGNKIESLCDRARRTDPLFTAPFSESVFQTVESALGVELPTDFKEIGRLFRYDALSSIDFIFWSEQPSEGIIKKNLDRRLEFQDHHYLSDCIILSDDDAGAVLLFGQKGASEDAVIWCDAPDLCNYAERGEFAYAYDKWLSFTDFFEYLVEQEEAKLKDDA